jgi:Trp operon repressor
MREPGDRLHTLEAVVAAISTEDGARLLLETVFSASENAAATKRWLAIQLARQGKTQRAIKKQAQTSVVTATRAVRVWKDHRDFVESIIKRLSM